MTHVTIIGSGNMGQAISGLVSKGGNTVELLRHSDTGKPVTGDIVVLAVPHAAIPDILATRGDQLVGKVVVDITNPLNFQTFDSLTRGSGCTSAARKASPPTGSTTSARSRDCATTSSRPVSTPWASSAALAPAPCSPTGSLTAVRRWICPRPTPAGWPRTRPTGATWNSGSPRASTSPTRSTGRSSSAHAHEGCAAAHCTSVSRLPGLSSANCWVGNGPTGTRPQASAEPTNTPSAGRTGFEHSAAEHQAVREAVGLFDTSSFGKLLVQGRDAESVLQRICANNVAVEPGRIVYTPWLNEFGGIEADVTVTRIDERQFLVLSGPATISRDRDWLERHIGPGDFATVTDISGTLAMVPVMGPRSRRLLQSLTDADMSHEAFPFGASREIDLGCGFVRATRITYVGELGWELLIPADLANYVYEAVVSAGTAFGLRHAGYHALDSLRMERGYRSWGHDISSSDTPLDAGLSFAVAWDKPGGFIGREVLLRQREQGARRRLMHFTLDDPDTLAYHDEPIYQDGEQVGHLSSAAYGHTLGRTVALGYVTAPAPSTEPSWYAAGGYEIEVAAQRIPAQASLRPFYDPKGTRVRC